MSIIYLIGSLRNPNVPVVGDYLRTLGFEVFDDWHEAGPIADDCWRAGELAKGRTYQEALKGYAAQHVFSFDYKHLNRANIGVLLLPAGVSGHLELGYLIGSGKPGFVLAPPENELVKLPPDWKWLAGLYEGEGSCSCSKAHNRWYPRLSIGNTDKEVLDRVAQITGIKTIHGPYKRNNGHFGSQPMFFWQPGKLVDITRIVRGIWHDLSSRRKIQIMKTMTKCGMDDDFKSKQKDPWEYRWDVMYNFTNGVYFDQHSLGQALLSLS